MDRDEVDFCDLVEQHLLARQIAFMQGKSPDLWHRFADGVNWDGSLEGLYWVVRQPACDRATAAMIFWKGEPAGYDYEDDDRRMGDDPYAVEPLLKFIAKRFNTDGFPRAEIAYHFLRSHGRGLDPQYDATVRQMRLTDIAALLERQKDHPDPLIKLHPDLARLELPGRGINAWEPSEWDDTFPSLEVAEQKVAELLGVVGEDLYGLPPFMRSQLPAALRR
ncbi:MAG: hypothetical protein C0511_19285 [Hyphomicrobium sp.]|nr:hypothetical protein [Hyphomicrobium sp.]